VVASARFINLNLQHNALSGSIPSEIKQMQKIKELFLEGNQLTGTIPPEIGNLQASLEKLLLSDNRLHGPMPTELGQLEHLVDLFLDRNLLTGTLPTELGNLANMLEFSVQQNNRLVGDIPDTFYNTTNLFRLDLSECNFTGTISPMVGNLTDMTYFLIHGNAFTGTIPLELATRASRTSNAVKSRHWRSNGDVQVQDNLFHGTMPSEFCELGGIKTLVADCAPDPVTGDIELQCGCCTERFDTEGHLYNAYQGQEQQQVQEQQQRPSVADDEGMGRLR
jgi:hypothetical protein